MPNSLVHSSSPYLLQHADNPVDWVEWGPEAFAEARRRDVPVLLSVGYAACHWCHVMAHESFEDAATAALMNESFVCVKVDREERPDVDAVYMDYVTALTGHGGWPMTAFLTPDGEAFYAGTYYPPKPRHGIPSFTQLLQAIAATWRDRRTDAVDAASRITRALAERTSAARGEAADAGVPGPAELASAVTRLAGSYDATHGGFGGAPKFPPSTVLEFLLRHHRRTGDPRALAMVSGTCEAMARGGLYDQLAGGFARYSVDQGWVVPHFEKMVYDNALLLRVYADWWRATGDPLARRVTGETADFLLRDLLTPEGGFASALDADTDGVEGLTYAWTPDQLDGVLGPADASWAAELLSVTAEGNFEAGASTLQLRADPDDPARWDSVRERLLAARAARPQPALDDKVVTSWNGLAIAALAEAGALLGEPAWVGAACRAARLLLDVHAHERDGELRLVRVSRHGRAGRHEGVLSDYADLADGLLALTAATGDGAWLTHARRLLETVLVRFPAPDGSFFDTASDAESLVRRPQELGDQATPAGTSAAAGALLTCAAANGDEAMRAAAGRALAAVAPLATEHPRFGGRALAVAEAWVDGPREIAVVGPPGQPDTLALLDVARRHRPSGAVLAFGDAEQPLLRGRESADGRATAYVCRSFVCQRPVTTTEDLLTLLRDP